MLNSKSLMSNVRQHFKSWNVYFLLLNEIIYYTIYAGIYIAILMQNT